MAIFFRAFATAGALAGVRAPLTAERFAYVQALGAMFAWSSASTATSDSTNVIAPSDGSVGRWLRVVIDDAGANLTDADASLTIVGGRKRLLPAATLSGNRTLTLATTNAQAGDEIEITRLDVGAFTVAIVNGGAGGGTLATLPISARSYIACRFDGSNWRQVRSGLAL